MVVQIMTGYTIVSGNVTDVINTVNEMIKDKWQPLGAAFTNIKLSQDVRQTMVKYGSAQVGSGGGGGPAGRITVPTGMEVGTGGRG